MLELAAPPAPTEASVDSVSAEFGDVWVAEESISAVTSLA